MNHYFASGLISSVSLALVLAGCSSSSSTDMGSDASSPIALDAEPAPSLGAPNAAPSAGDDQNPPTTNGVDVEAWLAQGAYKSWACETLAHSQMKVSPHGRNRICSNAKTSTFAGAMGDERPVGSAAVKELYDDSDKLVGYAVYAKVKPTSDGGASWYWYERVPTSSMAPNTAGIVADGLGSAGRALTICVGCHAGAGSNEDHTVLRSSDFVYDQVAL